MEKMIKLWDEEDEGKEEDDEDLEDKQELMKGYQMLGPLVDQAKDAARQRSNDNLRRRKKKRYITGTTTTTELEILAETLEEAREFAEKQTYEQERNEEFEKKVEQMKGEMRMVEEEESVDAMRAFERLQMTSSIGIFDTAFEPGEWNSASEGGHQTGLVGISTTRGFSIENEQRRIELSEIQSKVTSLREKLEQVEQAKSNLGLDMRTILERKDHILQEIKQVRTEQDDLNGELAGPPRRDPSEHEKQQFHTLVTRRAKYMKQLGDLDSRIAHIQKRAAIVQRSEASLLPMLRETEEKLTEIQAQVDIIEKERHDLPVVIGKAISQSEKLQILPENDEKVTVSKPFVNPIKLLNQVTMESSIEWWSHRIPKKSTGLTYSTEQNSIMLAEGETTGKITGCFHLPKRCFYRIQMSVSIQRINPDCEPGDSQETLQDSDKLTEDWKLYIGPEMDSLQHHTFRDIGGKVRDLVFEFSGIRLCFSLEITHKGIVDSKRKTLRYVISNAARYEERLEDFREEENRIRLLQKEKHFVSELVKTMRMQSKKSSSQRTTEILEELIRVEKSKAKMWDSTLFHGHSQRFKRAEMDFQARKSALMEPKRLAVQTFLGDYCSFKSQVVTSRISESYGTEAMILGVRYEWREARTKLHVMHKVKKHRRRELCCDSRGERDEILVQQMQSELARREKLFYADAIRLTTYNETISSQIDFQVQRKLNVLTQISDIVELEPVVQEVKENFAKQFVQGKLALVKKTWERKTKRVTNKRIKARKEREFRIRHEQELMKEINESNELELAALKHDQEKRAREELLRIPNFQVAVEQKFQCEHLELKAWGTKYDFGLKCKICGKEMSKSCDDPAHARGGDRELDEDVLKHRAQTTSGMAFRFKDANHLRKVENERLRLEKEARSMEEVESILYDRLDPKSIDDFNYRHGINRGTLLDNVDSSDPLYPRLIQDIHRASHQDEILFHGRLRNFNFRIQQIFRQHAECTERLAMQREFLENVQHENDIVLKKLPLIEADHARAEALIEEDNAAVKSFEDAKIRLTTAQKEREVGVEEEAEFSEFHAPALIKSSDEMNAVLQRIQNEFEFVTEQLGPAKTQLEKAQAQRNNVDQLMNRLYCRTQNSILRTRYGFVRVEYYRPEDSCVVVSPLHWEATLFIPIDEILAYEAIYRQEETFAMAGEDENSHEFLQLEHERERNTISVESLAQQLFGEILADTIKDLSTEHVQQRKHDATELLRTKGSAIVATDQNIALSGSVVQLLGLDRLWIARKQKYSLLYATWRKEFAKLQLVREEMARREELRRLAEEERQRLETRRKEMLAEERRCRKFYMEEIVLYMQERKAMASAEMEMEEYLRQVELEAMKTKYSKMIEDRNRFNDKAARRREIKQGKNEQHRLHREWRQIKIEDELAMQIRENERARALAEALERQFDKYLADQMAQGKISAQMEASRLEDRLREAQQVAAEKHRAFTMKMVQERMIASVETFYALSRAEVEWMDAIERTKFWNQRSSLLEENLAKMEPELKRINEEREHVVNDAKAKREFADKCKKRIEDADSSLLKAIQEKEMAMLKYERVHKRNATIDSERWLCCDKTEEGRYGSSGCARRFHLPVRNNPELENLVEKKTSQEQTVLDQINQQLLELRERNVVGKMKFASKSVVSKMEQDLAKQRAAAAKFHTLDRR
ncbi:hypothetical protein GQ600_27028 [Phytophthora cactorum]|nr:hypothetical protein GQ600_27028 [Phytophthora cactorum]